MLKRSWWYIFGILELILKSNTKSNCSRPELVRQVWQTGQTGFASQSNQHSSSRFLQLPMQAYLHASLIPDNHFDSRSFRGLNFQKPRTSEEFPRGWVPAAILGTSGKFPGTSEVCTSRKNRDVWPLEFMLKLGNFFHLFLCFNLVYHHL
jgi:hypothetical protein